MIPEQELGGVPSAEEPIQACARCGGYYADGALFCRFCGNRIAPPLEKESQNLFSMLGRALLGIIVFVLLFELCYMAFRSAAVYEAMGAFAVKLFFLLPLPYDVATLSGAVLQYYWVLILIILFACGALLLLNLFKTRKSWKTDPSAVEKTDIYWVAVLMTASLSVQVIMSLLGKAAGMPVDPSWMDRFTKDQLMFLMVEAAVWEEFVTRVCIIGVPVALLALIKTRDAKSVKYLFGRFEMSKTALIFLIISSTVFGLAHYDGWGIVKIFMTALGGFVVGYVYIRFGLHASIGMHFINNSLSMFSWAGLLIPAALVNMTLIGLGLMMTVMIIIKIMKVKDWKGRFMNLPMISKK